MSHFLGEGRGEERKQLFKMFNWPLFVYAIAFSCGNAPINEETFSVFSTSITF